MNLEFRESFVRDLKKAKDSRLSARIQEVIRSVEQAQSLADVRGVRKLRGSERHYRIRLGEYRVGLSLEGSTVTFVRFLHRRDIYRYFP